MLLTASHVSKSFGATTVLDDVLFVINYGERAGIVGPNGVGKSTLLRILAGREELDSGTVSYAPSVEIGYLSQTTAPFYGRTIDDLILESVGNIRQLEDQMRQLEVGMATANGDELATLLEEYGHASTKFQERGGYDLDYKIDTVMAGLRLSYLSRTRDVDTLSGGEKARVSLAALLLRAPDVLLLDEPTNHLDVASLNWLETYLSQYNGAVAMVSHDRQFLNRAVNRIFEIDEYTHRLRRYEGSYDTYRLTKELERQKWELDYERQQEEIKGLQQAIRVTARAVGGHNRPSRDNEKYGFNARGERAQHSISRSVRAAEEQLRRVQANPIPKPSEPLHINPHFNIEPLQSSVAISASHLTKSFGATQILRDLNFVIEPEARIVLVGPNGAGKTTLLEILVGIEEPDCGEVYVAMGARLGYLPQEPQRFDLNQIVLKAYQHGLIGHEEDLVADALRYGLLRYEDLTKAVGQLSIGQRRKLEILRLIAERPNILLLDEPTNHISLDVLEAFEAAIIEFAGPVIAVSHDRWFIDRFKGDIWELSEGHLIKHLETPSWINTSSVDKRLTPTD